MPLGMSGCVLITGPIPWRDARDWCADRGLGRQETRVVVAVLRRLDEDHARREHERLHAAAQKS